MRIGDLKLYFLGTGGTHPTKDRGLISMALKVNRDLFLLDAGEGCLRSMFSLGLSPMKVKGIAITHLHGDHVWGLPGLLATMALYNRKEELTIIGPKGTYEFISGLIKLNPFWRDFKIRIIELKRGGDVDFGLFKLIAGPAEHSCEALSYKIVMKEKRVKVDVEKLKKLGIEPGPILRKIIEEGGATVGKREIKLEEIVSEILPPISIVYSGDTRPIKEMIEFSKGADVLIHEASFPKDYEDFSYENFHSTSADAARIAKEAGVKRLYLIHFSPIVKDLGKMLKEAREIYSKAEVAVDLSYLDLLRIR